MPEGPKENLQPFPRLYFASEPGLSPSLTDVEVSIDPNKFGWTQLSVLDEAIYMARPDRSDVQFYGNMMLLFANSDNGIWQAKSIKGDLKPTENGVVLAPQFNTDFKDPNGNLLSPVALLFKDSQNPNEFSLMRRLHYSISPQTMEKFSHTSRLYIREKDKVFEPIKSKEKVITKTEQLPRMPFPSELDIVASREQTINTLKLRAKTAVKRLIKLHHFREIPEDYLPTVNYDEKTGQYRVDLLVSSAGMKNLTPPKEDLQEIGDGFEFGTRLYFLETDKPKGPQKRIHGSIYYRSYGSENIESYMDRLLIDDVTLSIDQTRTLPEILRSKNYPNDFSVWQINMQADAESLSKCLWYIDRSLKPKYE